MKTKLLLAAIIAILSGLALWAFSKYQKERQSRIYAGNNIAVLLQENQQLRKDSTFLRTGIITMTANELRKAFPEMEARLKAEFDKKLKNVYQVTSTETKVNQTFKTFIKDSVIRDTVTLKYMAYKDEWIDFAAEQIDSTLYVTRNINRVPLTQVISREKWAIKYIFPWNWGKRQLIQDVRTENPHATIEFSRTINIEK